MLKRDCASTAVPGGSPGDASVLNAFVLYENVATGLSAKYLLERMTLELGLEVDLSERLWKYDAVRDPLLKTEAMHQAENSDVVIVSANGGGEPPKEVKSWLREWIDHRTGKPCALMFWDDARDASPSATTNEAAAGAAPYWREMAHATNLEFYSNLKDLEVAFEDPAELKEMGSAGAACALMASRSGRNRPLSRVHSAK
jgi:hypothetical protein